MNYEEFNKSCLEEARKLYQTANADQRYVLEKLFPELSESEDERIRKAIIGYIDHGQHYGVSNKEMLAWLEKQGEQKPAWSEKDEVMLDKVIERIHKHSAGDEEYLDIYYWLIALKDRVQPQSQWKPSDEQVKALKDVREGVFRLGILESLYQDLMKLKG